MLFEYQGDVIVAEALIRVMEKVGMVFDKKAPYEEGSEGVIWYKIEKIAYTEIHVTNTYWPEFSKADMMKAIYEYQNRERRFGKISEQLIAHNG